MVHPAQIDAILSCMVALSQKTTTSEFWFPPSVSSFANPYGDRVRFPDEQRLTVLGKLLLKANDDSVNARYRTKEEDNADMIAAYRFRRDSYAAAQDFGFLAALIENFDYQACEVHDWDTSEAKRWLDWALRTGVKSLPSYKAAGWGYDGPPAASERAA
jgi:hypothetical protein